ncbi:hypothetical protein [Bdellovibrio sp.]|uniref:hypothetical protein n=1 Tax=Bdellovibrio sp. TaxID=28201 RepID=UPI0039E24414
MKWTLLVVLTLFSVMSSAQAKKNSSTLSLKPELSLREKALAESKVEGLAKTSATDAQVPGMLTLKDPRPEIITRSWRYFAGLTAQSFQPEGIAKKEGSGAFDLGKNDQTFMPGLELGVLSTPIKTKSVLWKLGLRGKAGFSSQGTSLTLDSGYQINDARLNTTLFSGGPLLTLQWEGLQSVSLTLSPQMGSVTYTQTSSNEFATFSKQSGFESMSYGLDFALGQRWSLFTEWSQRTLKDNTEIALQKDNFELGTKVTW